MTIWRSSVEAEPTVKQEANWATEIQRFLGWGLMRRGHTKMGVLLTRSLVLESTSYNHPPPSFWLPPGVSDGAPITLTDSGPDRRSLY
jgi:hypothetical protein